MQQFTINFKSHIRLLWPYVFVTLLLPALIYFLLIYKKGEFNQEVALLSGSIFFILYSIPVLLLHIKYYFTNRGDIFYYDKLYQRISYQTKEELFEFNLSDIEKITVFKSNTIAENRTPILIWDYYNYAIIELKDGTVFKISSLLVYELDRVLKFENTEIKKTLYAWIA